MEISVGDWCLCLYLPLMTCTYPHKLISTVSSTSLLYALSLNLEMQTQCLLLPNNKVPFIPLSGYLNALLSTCNKQTFFENWHISDWLAQWTWRSPFTIRIIHAPEFCFPSSRKRQWLLNWLRWCFFLWRVWTFYKDEKKRGRQMGTDAEGQMPSKQGRSRWQQGESSGWSE